jgi:hypothetical protein
VKILLWILAVSLIVLLVWDKVAYDREMDEENASIERSLPK